jgi:hypothetical protein
MVAVDLTAAVGRLFMPATAVATVVLIAVLSTTRILLLGLARATNHLLSIEAALRRLNHGNHCIAAFTSPQVHLGNISRESSISHENKLAQGRSPWHKSSNA